MNLPNVKTHADKYEFSDIKAMPWVLMGPWAGISHKDTPKEVHEWVDRIYERSAVQKGLVRPVLSV